jgi:hypothetical protein
VIEAAITGVLRGAATSRRAANGGLQVTAFLNVMSHDGLIVDVTVLAHGEAGATLLRFADGDRVEVVGPISPRVFIDRADNHFVRFDLVARVVRRTVRRERAA